MNDCIERYLRKDRHYQILDFGSFINQGQTAHHRVLLRDHRCTVTGVDIQAGRNVDIQMRRPYRIPVPSRSQDVVLSGQVFEHIPFPFASILEIARVLKPGGLVFITVPSRGHRHSTYDLWRFYPDSMRALAAQAELELLEVHTDWPPREQRRHQYARIDPVHHYWGDTTAVFRKPAWKPSLWRLVHRAVVLRRANQIGDLESVPLPPRRPLRRRDRRAGQRQVRTLLRRDAAGEQPGTGSAG
jgi:SAM-dependent methyltransferase